MFACGTTDTPGCVMYADGTCSCARNAGVAGACGSCAQKMIARGVGGIVGDGPCVVETDHGAYVMRDYPGQKLVDYLGAGAPMHGGGHGGGGHGGGGGHVMHGGGHGGHFGGGHRARRGGRGWGWSNGSWTWGDWWPVYVVVYDCPPGYYYDVYGNCVPIPAGTGAEVVEPASTFPIWPMILVGGVAVGIFVATLSIKPKRR